MALNLQDQQLSSVLQLVKRGLAGDEDYNAADIEEQFAVFTSGDLNKNLAELDEEDCLSLLEILWEFTQSAELSPEDSEYVKSLVGALEEVTGGENSPVASPLQVADLLTETADYIEVKNIPEAAQGVTELAELINFGNGKAVADAMGKDPASALTILQSFFSASNSGVSVANLVHPEALENFIVDLSEVATENSVLADVLEYVDITL